MVQSKNRRLVTESALELFINTQAASPVATLAELPAANSGNMGLIRFVTSENEPYYSNGTTWSSIAQGAQGDPGPAGAGVPSGGEPLQIVRKNSVGTTTEWATPSKSMVGLSNVDNTSDMNKPVSTLQNLALDEKADKAALDQFKPASGTRAVGLGELVVNVLDYGAKGDWVSGTGTGTDNLSAFNAAYQAAQSASTFGATCLYIPRGKYRFSDEWDIYRPNSPRKDVVIRGESQWTTFLISDFYGAGKALVKSRDPLGQTRCSPTSLYDLQLGTVDRDGPNPVMIDIYGAGESRLEAIRFGSCNNTHLSLASLQNVRMRDIVSFYGGKHFNYRDTTGVTFSSTAGSIVLTASAPIFNALDPGRTISLHHSNGTRVKYRISSYTSDTQVNINPATPAITLTGVPGHFEPARITTTAGSNQVSANASVFSTDDVGRVIYIKGAKAGAWGNALLRGRITGYVSGATVTLDVVADRSITRTEFASPVIDFYTPNVAGTLGAGSNDVKLELLHVENYAGVGLVVQNSIFMHFNDLKIHGEQSPTASHASHAQMWLDDYSGVISGELDGAATGPSRVYLCNFNDLCTFDWIATKRVVNGITFEVEPMTDPGGIAEVRTFNVYTPTPLADPYGLVTDTNAVPRLVFTGMVNMLGDTEAPRIYAGKNTYHTLNGDMVTKSPDGTRYKVTVANGGVISATAV